MSNMIVESKIEGKKVTLELTQNEVASALSICQKNSTESVIVMKRPHKGGALFFTNSQKAAACQDRHGFEYSFSVKLSELKKFKPDQEPVKPVDKKDEAIQGLKDLVAELRDEATKKDAVIKENKEAVASVKGKDAELVKLNKAIGDKDTEIGLQKEAIDGIETKVSEAVTEVVKLKDDEIAVLKAEIVKLKK